MNNGKSLLLPDCGSQELPEAIDQQTQDPGSWLVMLPGNKAEKEVSRRCSGAVGSRDSEQGCFLEWVLSKDHLLGLQGKRAGSFVTPAPPKKPMNQQIT